MIKTVIFDLDDTLYAFGPAEQTGRAAIRDYVQRVVGIDGDAFMACFVEMLNLQFKLHGDSCGCHSRAIRAQLACERMGLPLRHAVAINDLFWNAYVDSMTPFPAIPGLFDALHENGIKIVICTNMMADWQMKKLLKLGLLDKCDFVVTSEEAAVEKPARAIFDLCAEKAGCLPSECLFIGDNPVCDIQGAQAAGMQVLWLAQNPETRAKYPDLPFVASPGEIAARIGLKVSGDPPPSPACHEDLRR